MPRTYTADEFGALEAKCLSLQEALTEAQRSAKDTARASLLLREENAKQSGIIVALQKIVSHADSAIADYEFAIGQAVVIVGPDFHGNVTGQLTDATKRQYKVVWWNNGERKHEWLEEPEIRSAT